MAVAYAAAATDRGVAIRTGTAAIGIDVSGGKIAAVLVENGDAVEFGQQLFQVEKAS